MNIVDKVLAQTTQSNVSTGQWNFLNPVASTSSTGVAGVINNVITIVLWIAGALAVIYLIYSGILYITAAGNPDAAKKGQQGIINAVIGIVIIVLAFVILRAVFNTTSTMFK